MTIRPLNSWEVGACVAGGKAFFAEGKLVGGFDPEYFTRKWEGLVADGFGHVIGLFDDARTLIGALAWKTAMGDFAPIKVAVESWWFVFPEHRGCGLLLLDYYEAWCARNKVVGAMVHLVNVESERLGELYQKRGYREFERVYVRDFGNIKAREAQEVSSVVH